MLQAIDHSGQAVPLGSVVTDAWHGTETVLTGLVSPRVKGIPNRGQVTVRAFGDDDPVCDHKYGLTVVEVAEQS